LEQQLIRQRIPQPKRQPRSDAIRFLAPGPRLLAAQLPIEEAPRLESQQCPPLDCRFLILRLGKLSLDKELRFLARQRLTKSPLDESAAELVQLLAPLLRRIDTLTVA